jgi:SAM-dependent methyltransferase
MTAGSLAHHEVMGLLGVGDLHPGGRAATELLLRELGSRPPGRILELGAGIGATTASLLARGWEVTAVEPSPTLRPILARRAPAARVVEALAEAAGSGEGFDAVIAEGVLYSLDLAEVLPTLARLIRPGGLMALCDVALVEGVDAALVASVHRRTKALFGFPMVPAEVLTWKRWNELLGRAGFAAGFAERVSLVGRPGGDAPDRLRRALALARHPRLALAWLRFRLRGRRAWMPAGSTEGWAATFTRVGAPPAGSANGDAAR